MAKVGDTLEFSYIGHITEHVLVGNSSSISVCMQVDSHVLNEVVVVGYSIKKEKKALGYAVTSVGAEQLESRAETDVARQLSGKAAGVNITSAGGASGSATSIVIRGITSFRGNNQAFVTRSKRKRTHQSIANALSGKISGVATTPNNGLPSDLENHNVKVSRNQENAPLYIVDGVPIQKQNNAVIEKLNPKNIDKINVYKGNKAKRLFGSIANNGCIVITTKKGTYQIENDDNYAQLSENNFEEVAMNPLSTFSIDVDKAGYSNVRRMINNGQKVPVDAVKIEEMVNYFDYNYRQPEGEHPFSIHTEAAQTPWNTNTKLVRIGLQGKEYANEELPASNLTFLIDVSGSMGSSNKLPLLKSAFKLLVSQLREKDKVSIVVYAGAAGVVLKPTRGNEKEKILEALNNLESGGSTAGGAGIQLAYKLAEENFKSEGNNRVILATDGDFNVGASSNIAMEELIEEKRKSGVFLSVLGFGMGNYKDSKLELLADKGNGNHAYIDTMQEAQKVFGKEFGGTLYTIAKDVKIQVEFNPTQVQAYRLIGYANRLLADEDFVDDTKDAGELGSGHKVTALYEVIPTGVSSKFLKDKIDLKYTKVENQTDFSDELLTVKFRYKKPQGKVSIEMVAVLNNEISEMSSDFKFASAVALYGMQLKKSAYRNDTSIKDVIALAQLGRGADKLGYRAEFIRLVNSNNNNW
jgi:Ca-activated chloride channel family protein